MTDARISIQLVSWNGIVHLPSCLRSIEAQTLKPKRLLIVDNGSVDETVRWLQANAPTAYVLRNNRNLGFCRGHNQAFRLANTPYVLCLNQDIVLDPQWLDRAVQIMDDHPEVGALGGMTVRSDYDENSLTGIKDSGIIDSTGLVVYRSRHAVDRDSGTARDTCHRPAGSVFGLNAACIVYRMAALESIRYQDEYFDDDFFAYKDDIDTSWRLRRAGWECWYDPRLIAFHHRTIRGEQSVSSLQIARQHRRRKQVNAWFSYRNHLLLLIKNETRATFWRDAAWILWYEFRKAGYLLVTQPRALTAWRDILKLRTNMRRKAKTIRTTARCTPMQIRTWFLHSS